MIFQLSLRWIFVVLLVWRAKADTSGPNSQKSAFSILGSRTVIPDQSQLDQVDEEALKNAQQIVKVNQDNEVITETVEDDSDPSTSSQPLTVTETTTDDETVEKNTERPQLPTQAAQVTTSVDKEQSASANSLNDALSKPSPLENNTSDLNVSSSTTFASGSTTNVDTVSQTMANQNLGSVEKQATTTGFPQKLVQSAGNVLESTKQSQNDGKPTTSPPPITMTETITDDEAVEKNTERPQLPTQAAQVTTSVDKEQSASANSLNDALSKPSPLENNTSDLNVSSSTAFASGSTTNVNAVSQTMANQNLGSVEKQAATTDFPQKLVQPAGGVLESNKHSESEDRNTRIEKLDKNLESLQNGNQNKGLLTAAELKENPNGLPDTSKPISSTQETLGTSEVASSSPNAILGSTGASNTNHNVDIQRVDQKPDANGSVGHEMSPPGASQRFTSPSSIKTDNVVEARSLNDSSNDVSDSKNSGSVPVPGKMDSKIAVTSTVGTQSPPQGSLSEKGKGLDEEKEMENYGLPGTPSPKKLSLAIRRMHVMKKPSSKTSHDHHHLHKSTSTQVKTSNKRLKTFLKDVKQMFMAPETAEDIMGWEAWTPCSRSCGKHAFRTRLRKCGRLVQRDFDVACPEPRVETQKCKAVSCSDASRKEKLKKFLKLTEEGDARTKQFSKADDDQKMIDQMFGKNLDHPRVFLGGDAFEKSSESNDDGAEHSNDNASDDGSEEPEFADDGGSRIDKKHYLYTVWGSWSACSFTCGQRAYAFRKRYCINGVSGEIKQHCQKPTILAKKCVVNPCPVDGGLSPWSEWSSCSDSCGIMERHRSCSNPKPAYGGKGCHRLPVQMRMCGSCRDEKVAAIRKLSAYSPKVMCGFDPCQKVGCLENKGAICVTDFECNPTFFDDHGNVLKSCKDLTNLFLRPFAQKRCSFDPCSFTRCHIKGTKCLVDTKCRPFFVNNEGKKISCKGSNVLHISSEVMCGFNPCQISSCTVDPDAKCVTDYRCKPMFVNFAGKRISGCTEDEAEEANIISSQKTLKDEQETTNMITGEEPSAVQHLYDDLQGTAESYREEQSAKKSIEGRVDNTKHKLQVINLLESILKRRLRANATNSKSFKNLHNTSKNNNEPKNRSKNYPQIDPRKASARLFPGTRLSVAGGYRKNKTSLNLSGENIVMTTVHRNDTETTEVADHAPLPSGQGSRLEQNAKNSEKTKLVDNGSRVGSHPLKFVETPLDSESWTDAAGSKKLEQEEEEDIKNVYKYIMDTFGEKNSEKTNAPELASTDDSPGGESVTSFGPGGMPLSANSEKIYSTRLSTPMNPENESVIHHELGKPLWAIKDSGNKGGHTGKQEQSAERGHDTSRVSPKESSGDVKSDDPYVYPMENYLADMANDNGVPESFDDTTDSVASGESAEQSEYDDNDTTFPDSDFHEHATGGKLKNVNSISNDEKATTISSATSENTGQERKQNGTSSKSSSDLGVQIPLYDMNAASSALSTLENKDSQDIPTNVESNEGLQETTAGNSQNSTEKIQDKSDNLYGESGQNKVNETTALPVQSPPQADAHKQRPLTEDTAVNTTDQKQKLFDEVILKAVADEVMMLKEQGLLGDEENKDWDTQEGTAEEGTTEKEGDDSDHEANPADDSVFGDDSEKGQLNEANIKKINDFLKHDNLGLGDIDGKTESTESTNPGGEDKDSNVWDEEEGFVEESPNDYKVSLVPRKDGDAETEVTEVEENRMDKDSSDSDVHHGNVREPEFKESYSPDVSKEIKELGLHEYYVKDGFKKHVSKQHKEEDGELRHILSNRPLFPGLKKDDSPVRIGKEGKKFRTAKRPSVELGIQANFRKHNVGGDEIEREPSNRRGDGVEERSETEEKRTESLDDPGREHGDGKNGDEYYGGTMAKYLNHVEKYINRLDGGLLSGEQDKKNLDEAKNDENFGKALVFDAKDDSKIPRIEELASRKHDVVHSGGTMDDDDDDVLEKAGVIALHASEHHPAETSEDKKSRIKTRLKQF